MPPKSGKKFLICFKRGSVIFYKKLPIILTILLKETADIINIIHVICIAGKAPRGILHKVIKINDITNMLTI